MKPLSEDEIVELGKEQISDGRLSLQQMGRLSRLFHTALMAHKLKEALEFYKDAKISYGVNVVEEDLGEWGIIAKRALTLWDKE